MVDYRVICHCGRVFTDLWSFCPDCGADVCAVDSDPPDYTWSCQLPWDHDGPHRSGAHTWN